MLPLHFTLTDSLERYTILNDLGGIYLKKPAQMQYRLLMEATL